MLSLKVVVSSFCTDDSYSNCLVEIMYANGGGAAHDSSASIIDYVIINTKYIGVPNYPSHYQFLGSILNGHCNCAFHSIPLPALLLPYPIPDSPVHLCSSQPLYPAPPVTV